MNICYSIDALSPAGDKAWRLQTDHTWRPCSYAEPLQPDDARITDKSEAEHWIGRRLKKDKDTVLAPRDKAGKFDFLMRGIFAHAVMHRLSSATVPDKARMIDIIKGLTPGTPWLIYLNAEGDFRSLDTDHESIIGNLDIAVRGEIASSEDYVGEKAAADDALMDRTWRQFLGGWLEHLSSSNMGIFVPDIEKLKEADDYIAAIEAWAHE
ncbi:MAG: hypothetical protein R8L58_04010 [Mariprofundaceae bacterium]